MSWLRHALERTQISFDGQADVGLGFLEDALPELPDVYGPPERRRLEEAFFKLELLMEQKEAGKPLALPASLHRATLEDVLDAATGRPTGSSPPQLISVTSAADSVAQLTSHSQTREQQHN